MTSDLPTIENFPEPRHPERELRLRVKPATAARHGADGAWWPWSIEPATEFPALIMALSSWVGPARCLAYHPGDWQHAGHSLTVEGWTVSLEARPAMAAGTIVLIGPNLRQLCVVVVPPGTPSAEARAALRSASRPGATGSAADRLSRDGRPGTAGHE